METPKEKNPVTLIKSEMIRFYETQILEQQSLMAEISESDPLYKVYGKRILLLERLINNYNVEIEFYEVEEDERKYQYQIFNNCESFVDIANDCDYLTELMQERRKKMNDDIAYSISCDLHIALIQMEALYEEEYKAYMQELRERHSKK